MPHNAITDTTMPHNAITDTTMPHNAITDTVSWMIYSHPYWSAYLIFFYLVILVITNENRAH